jgi:hypothetical protein
MNQTRQTVPSRRRQWMKRLLFVYVVAVASGLYVWTHPLVFNESFWEHSHCIAQAGGALRGYAGEHFGNFPVHTNGYGDALLILLAEGYQPSGALTGPGYDRFVFDRALKNHTEVPESECGRVYVQGLSESTSSEIAILFDKIPSPGDHCHFLHRLWKPVGREVLMVDGSHRFIKETTWPEFTRIQVELLVKEGFSRTTAETVYTEKDKVH